VFAKILQKLAKEGTNVLVMDATHLKVHRDSCKFKGRGIRRGKLNIAREGQQITRCLRWL
jgi:hypothetical protein